VLRVGADTSADTSSRIAVTAPGVVRDVTTAVPAVSTSAVSELADSDAICSALPRVSAAVDNDTADSDPTDAAGTTSEPPSSADAVSMPDVMMPVPLMTV